MEDFREYEPQLVLLDIVLPLFNGFLWCQEIRKISKVPIIFLSSSNGFSTNSGRIVSRDNLITRLWESDEFIDDNTLTVNVARLRKKLEEIGAENWIQTKKGIGYIVE